jgi:hypothetical protein
MHTQHAVDQQLGGIRSCIDFISHEPLPEGKNEKSMAIDEHEIELEMRIN